MAGLCEGGNEPPGSLKAIINRKQSSPFTKCHYNSSAPHLLKDNDNFVGNIGFDFLPFAVAISIASYALFMIKNNIFNFKKYFEIRKKLTSVRVSKQFTFLHYRRYRTYWYVSRVRIHGLCVRMNAVSSLAFRFFNPSSA
ncbi:hypothetical protein ANN_12067 [Periplaneta americana]|uniref:Uncharacterized protein n=1 Tax=Periplaneta americana TaxID=6978 RepID=A0ABQ8T8A8_PERAM|nr:hypothetical protein ANN_12067 [Periplaneta americana]